MLLYSSGRQPVDRDRLVDLYHCPVAPENKNIFSFASICIS